MEPKDFLAVIRRRATLIAGLVILGGLIAFFYSFSLPVQYKATSGVMLTTQRGETTSELVQGSNFAQTNIQSYAILATKPIVLDPVIRSEKLTGTAQSLVHSISVDIPLNTILIDITVSNSEAEKASRIANAISTSLADVVQKVSPKDATGKTSVTVTTVSPAQRPVFPFAPNKTLILLTGIIVGLVLGLLIAFAIELFDTRVRNEEAIAKNTLLPFLGSIVLSQKKKNRALVMRTEPHGSPAEAYRRIRTNLHFSDVDKPLTSIVVTSSLPGEGKSTTAVNLAIALSERYERVLLIDADLRRPTIAQLCQLDGTVGLTTLLVGGVSLEGAVQNWLSSLDVLTSGTLPPNPGQLLGSQAMGDLMKNLLSWYDFIVIDSPPLLPATDALGLAHLTDGALVVARYKSTRKQNLDKALDSLKSAKATVIGIVLNAKPASKTDSYYGYQAKPLAFPPSENSAIFVDATKAETVVKGAKRVLKKR